MTDVIAPESTLLELERYRGELTGYCYRMLGSAFDADDAVQDTMVRAWQAIDQFEGRSSLRSWLYRIATNICLDSLRSRQRRALPMDLTAPVPATTVPGEPLPEATWLTPLPDADVIRLDGDPAERAAYQDTIRLAFVAALQHLPPRQRAVLILREVLAWQAAEVAELLDTTVASVNSALQRARATIAGAQLDESATVDELGEEERALLARYLQAFEAYDVTTLVSLLHEDASISMPPLALWLRGAADVGAWYVGHGIGCKGSRLIPTTANGMPAFGQYRRDPSGSGHVAWSLQVVEIARGAIAHIHHFLEVDGSLFPRFGLPPRLDD